MLDLLASRIDGASWLVSGLITRGGIAIIGGEPKSIKTWIQTAISLAIATGAKLFGRYDVEPGTVAIFYAEDGKAQVRNRFRALADTNGIPAGRLFVRPRGAFLDVTRDEDLAWLIASCRALGPIDLLVLDPLRDVSSAAENESDDMSPVMRSLRLVGEILGCTVLVVHHTGKGNGDTAGRRPGQRLRGSSAIHGSIDSGIYLSELSGDGVSRFRCIVDSEIKGARSAGRFSLELAIEDDDHDEAIKASWSIGDVTKKHPAPPVSENVARISSKNTAAEADAEQMLNFIRSVAVPKFMTELCRDPASKVPQKRAVPAVKLLLSDHRATTTADGKIIASESSSRANRGQTHAGNEGQA